MRSYLSTSGRVWLVEEGKDLGLGPLPEIERFVVVGVLPAELAGDLLLGGVLALDVQLVQDGEGGLEGEEEYLSNRIRNSARAGGRIRRAESGKRGVTKLRFSSSSSPLVAALGFRFFGD